MVELLDGLLDRDLRAKQEVDRFLGCLEKEFVEGFLEALLNLMSLTLLLSPDYRKNIENFTARYQFCSIEDKLMVAVDIRGGRMKVFEGAINDPSLTINFKNSKTLMDFVLSPKQDVLQAMLKQEVVLSGNLNYLYKFAYMARRLQLMATGQLS